MCFRPSQSDAASSLDNAQPSRISSTHRKDSSTRFLDAAIDRQYTNSWDALRGIGPSAEEPEHQEGKRKHEWEKPSWSDLFRVGVPPLQSYERDINRRQAAREWGT
ncbi:hypothetical protein MMC34_005661 [Xylographa carneopallida]|nr:hypothetical protein [Xylographa carneopallida]